MREEFALQKLLAIFLQKWQCFGNSTFENSTSCLITILSVLNSRPIPGIFVLFY